LGKGKKIANAVDGTKVARLQAFSCRLQENARKMDGGWNADNEVREKIYFTTIIHTTEKKVTKKSCFKLLEIS